MCAYLYIARFARMEPLSRTTPATVDVLSALIDAAEPVWGLAIVKHSGRPAGSVYPILERLEASGWVDSRWEDDPHRSGPRRRFYALTEDGAPAARETVEAFARRQERSAAGSPRTARPGRSASAGATGRVVLA